MASAMHSFPADPGTVASEKHAVFYDLDKRKRAFSTPTVNGCGLTQYHVNKDNDKGNQCLNIVESDNKRTSCLPENSSKNTEDLLLEAPLRGMSKEQLLSHYLKVVSMLKREKEVLLHEKTEEIFRLKRKLMREGSHVTDVASFKEKLAVISRKLNDSIGVGSVVLKNRSARGKVESDTFGRDSSNDNGKPCKLFPRGKNTLNVMSEKKIPVQCSAEGFILPSMDVNDKIEQLELENDYQMDILRVCLEEILKDPLVNCNLAAGNHEERYVKFNPELKSNEAHLTLDQHVLDQKSANIEYEKAYLELKNSYETDVLRIYMKETFKNKEMILNSAPDMFMVPDVLGAKDEIPYTTSQENQAISFSVESWKLDKQTESMLLNNMFAMDIFSLCLEETIKEQNLSLEKACIELLKQKHLFEDIIVERNNAIIDLCNEKEVQSQRIILLDRLLQESVKTNERQKDLLDQLVIGQKALKDNAILLEEAVNKNEILKDSVMRKSQALEKAVMSVHEQKQQCQLLQIELQNIYGCLDEIREDVRIDRMHTVTQFSLYCKALMDATKSFEENVLACLDQSSLRLEEMTKQLVKFRRLHHSLANRESLFRKIYQQNCCNLQKAEAEVDLLGDDVDNLLHLLGKVFTTLNHYAPILQHYPGISQLMKLIKKEILDHVDVEFLRCYVVEKSVCD